MLSLGARKAVASCDHFWLCQAALVATDCSERELVLTTNAGTSESHYLRFHLPRLDRARLRITCERRCTLSLPPNRFVPFREELAVRLRTAILEDRRVEFVPYGKCGGGVFESTAFLLAGTYAVDLPRTPNVPIATSEREVTQLRLVNAVPNPTLPQAEKVSNEADDYQASDLNPVSPAKPSKRGGCAGCRLTTSPSRSFPGIPAFLLALLVARRHNGGLY